MKKDWALKTGQKFQIFRQSIITLAPLNQCNIKVKRKGASFGIWRMKLRRSKRMERGKNQTERSIKGKVKKEGIYMSLRTQIGEVTVKERDSFFVKMRWEKNKWLIIISVLIMTNSSLDWNHHVVQRMHKERLKRKLTSIIKDSMIIQRFSGENKLRQFYRKKLTTFHICEKVFGIFVGLYTNIVFTWRSSQSQDSIIRRKSQSSRVMMERTAYDGCCDVMTS